MLQQGPPGRSCVDLSQRTLRLKAWRNRLRRRSKRSLHDPQHLLALPFDHRHQTAELEPGQLDVARSAQRPEAEIRQEVRGKDRLVHLEALVLRLPLAVPISERLEGLRAPISRIADRRKE